MFGMVGIWISITLKCIEYLRLASIELYASALQGSLPYGTIGFWSHEIYALSPSVHMNLLYFPGSNPFICHHKFCKT